MKWLPLASAITVLASAGVMFASINRVRDVLEILALAAEPHRTWLSYRIASQRRLMFWFLAGYLVLGAALLREWPVIAETALAAVVSAGALFVNTNIAVQARMGAAMLKTLQGLIPICAWCKRIKTTETDAEGKPQWESVERYLARRTAVDFTHGMCADCARTLESGRRGPSVA